MMASEVLGVKVREKCYKSTNLVVETLARAWGKSAVEYDRLSKVASVIRGHKAEREKVFQLTTVSQRTRHSSTSMGLAE